MIPTWLILSIDRPAGRCFHLRIPLLLVALALLPFAILLLPVVAVLCLVRRINPLRLIGAVLWLLYSTSGTRLEVQDSGASFLLCIV